MSLYVIAWIKRKSGVKGVLHVAAGKLDACGSVGEALCGQYLREPSSTGVGAPTCKRCLEVLSGS